MSPRAMRMPNGELVFTAIPKKLEPAFLAYMKLSPKERVRLSEILITFMEPPLSLGPQGALELVYKLGIFLNGGKGNDEES